MKIVAADDPERWKECLTPFHGGDVYYRLGYLHALQKRGEGEPILFSWREDGRAACHVAMKRALPDFAKACGCPPDACDLTSPYGYAGPLLDPPDDETAQAFFKTWTRASADMGAVAEFIRFHPLYGNHRPFASLMPVRHIAETVVIRLDARPVREGLSRPCLRNTRTAEKKGVSVEFLPLKHIERFAKLYRETMIRRGADDYYVFDDAYFTRLAEGMGEDLWIATANHEGADAAGALILRAGDTIHYHLGGSDQALRALCASNLLLVAVAERARESGLRFFHLGGGAGREPGLFHFKSGFSPDRLEFHVGRRIYDPAAYARLCEMRRSMGAADAEYFPAYRAPVMK